MFRRPRSPSFSQRPSVELTPPAFEPILSKKDLKKRWTTLKKTDMIQHLLWHAKHHSFQSANSNYDYLNNLPRNKVYEELRGVVVEYEASVAASTATVPTAAVSSLVWSTYSFIYSSSSQVIRSGPNPLTVIFSSNYFH